MVGILARCEGAVEGVGSRGAGAGSWRYVTGRTAQSPAPRSRGFRPMETCRISTLALNFQEVKAEVSKKKMLQKYVRSRYVYENKQKVDKMPGKKTDIYV